MSVDIKEARRKLDLLEKLANNPSLIMTDLFNDGVEGGNFLYQVNIDGKHISDYLKEHLCSLDVFKDLSLKFSSYELSVCMPGIEKLHNTGHTLIASEDRIVYINIKQHTYSITNATKRYTSVMNTKYELKVDELSDFWKRYEDFCFKSRIRNAINSFSNENKSFFVKVQDFFFNLFVSADKVKNAYKREFDRVTRNNSWHEKQYNRELARQMLYNQYAPEHIKLIRKRQESISKYLDDLGYTRDEDEIEDWCEIC